MRKTLSQWTKASMLASMAAIGFLPSIGGWHLKAYSCQALSIVATPGAAWNGICFAFQEAPRAWAAERDAAGGKSSPSARFEISFVDGRVVRIVMQPAGRSEQYVFDRFVDGKAAVGEEKERMAAGPARSGFCAALSLDAARCRQSCAWAEAARPFTRVSRLRADGSWEALSKPDQVPLRFNAGASSHTSLQGDCLSPDGQYLSVLVTLDGASQSSLPRVVELTTDLPDIQFIGRRTTRPYGENRSFDFTGWMRGAQHTLTFSFGGERSFDDDGMPMR